MSNIANNKRIARNTMMLYFRMMLMMAVTLYTSRVVLRILGVEDFGVYTIVGCIVLLFSFTHCAMSSSTQCYLTSVLGKSAKA